MKSEIKISENKTYSKTKILLTTNNFCFIYYVVSFVPPQGETGRLRRHVFYLFVHPFVCYQTCEQDILKTNEPLLMHTWCTGQGQEAINSGIVEGPSFRSQLLYSRVIGLNEVVVGKSKNFRSFLL